jgi:hypothetical protein
MLEKFGYGTDDVYEKIRHEVRRAPIFRFDWFLKSRTSIELMRRCGTLITMMSKEPVAELEDGDENKKRKANSDSKTFKKRK